MVLPHWGPKFRSVSVSGLVSLLESVLCTKVLQSSSKSCQGHAGTCRDTLHAHRACRVKSAHDTRSSRVRSGACGSMWHTNCRAHAPCHAVNVAERSRRGCSCRGCRWERRSRIPSCCRLLAGLRWAPRKHRGLHPDVGAFLTSARVSETESRARTRPCWPGLGQSAFRFGALRSFGETLLKFRCPVGEGPKFHIPDVMACGSAAVPA